MWDTVHVGQRLEGNVNIKTSDGLEITLGMNLWLNSGGRKMTVTQMVGSEHTSQMDHVVRLIWFSDDGVMQQAVVPAWALTGNPHNPIRPFTRM